MTIKPLGQGYVSTLLQQINGNQSGKSKDTLANNLLDDRGLVPKIEKHIDDYEKGKGYLSKKISKTIRSKDISTANTLSEINPKLSNLYNSYSTGLSYSKNARYTYGVNQSAETSRKLLDLYS